MTSAPPGYPKTAPRPTQCRHPIHLGYLATDRATGRTVAGVTVTRCKCWRCEGCGRRLRLLHGQLIDAAFTEHLQTRGERYGRFVTITLPTDTGALLASREDCAQVTRAVRLWAEDVRRHYSPRLEYYTVKEPTRRGRLHTHLLTFGPYLPKCRRTLPGTGPPCFRAGGCMAGPGRRPCIQELARRRGLGFVDVRAVRGRRHAAAYIAKYLGKAHIGQPWPRYSRRVTYSRDFAPTTIGRLGAEWSARAFTAGVAAGHIHPDPMPADSFLSWYHMAGLRRGPPVAYIGWPPGQGWTLDLARGTVRHLGSTQVADLDTGEVVEAPNVALSELALLRRQHRREAEAAAAIMDPADPLMADALVARLVYAEARRAIAVP